MATFLLTHSKYFSFTFQKRERSEPNSILNHAGNVENILKRKKNLWRKLLKESNFKLSRYNNQDNHVVNLVYFSHL